MSIQSDLFHACRELLPSLEEYQVNVVESSQSPGIWSVVVDNMKDRTPRAAVFQVDSRQWHMWSHAERSHWLTVRIGVAIAEAKRCNQRLLK